MENISLDYSKSLNTLGEDEILFKLKENETLLKKILNTYKNDTENTLGWMDIEKVVDEDLICKIELKAKEIMDKAEIFILIGVGGSNQGARAVLKSLQKPGTPEILYAGNNISASYINNILKRIKGKSVYINIIAKDFRTLEPGICFRIIRQYMEKTYGEQEAAKRIIATGSPMGSSLEKLAKSKGYLFLPFPLAVGGRFSVLSSVGLFPIAVGGIDIRELLKGASDMRKYIYSDSTIGNDALTYATIRNCLLNKGKSIEMLASFEPQLEYFSKWLVQLFAESEGKDGKGIFPTHCSFSEDLHSLGQYIQSGQKIIFETFLNIKDQADNYVVKKDITEDYFDYLEGKDFNYINNVAYESTVKAHFQGGVPCIIINIPKLTEYYFGQLFYFFEIACYISGEILGINTFDQPGVEAYKKEMLYTLKKGN